MAKPTSKSPSGPPSYLTPNSVGVDIMRFLQSRATSKTIPDALKPTVTKAGTAIGRSIMFRDPDIYMYVIKMNLQAITDAAKEKGLGDDDFVQGIQTRLNKIGEITEAATKKVYNRKTYDSAMKANAVTPSQINFKNPSDVRDNTLGLFNDVLQGHHNYTKKETYYTSKTKGRFLGRKKTYEEKTIDVPDMPNALYDRVKEARNLLAKYEESKDVGTYIKAVNDAISNVITFTELPEDTQYADHPMITDLKEIQTKIQSITDKVVNPQRAREHGDYPIQKSTELHDFLSGIDNPTKSSSTAPYQSARKSAQAGSNPVLEACVKALESEIADQKNNPTDDTASDNEFDHLVEHAKTLKNVTTVDDFNNAMITEIIDNDNCDDYPKLSKNKVGWDTIDAATDAASKAIQTQGQIPRR